MAPSTATPARMFSALSGACPVPAANLARRHFDLPQDTVLGLERFSQRTGIPLSTAILAALAALLNRYSGEYNIGMEVTGAGSLTLNLSGEQTFEELAEQFPLEQAHSDFSVIVSPEIQNQLVRSPFSADTSDKTPGLALSFAHAGKAIAGHVEYRMDLFDTDMVVRFVRHFENLLDSATEHPARSISQLTMLSEQERHQILFKWNDTQTPYPNGCISELFEQQAEKTPAAVALIDGNQRITYDELNQHANRLAQYLRDRGVGAEVLVGLCMEQSWTAVAGILGILKAGGAYVPLDPNFPEQRLAEMAQDARLALVVSSTRCRDRVPAGVEVVSIDEDSPAISAASSLNLRSGTTPDSPAYVLYTSGSTGTPKAVVGLHRSVINGLLSVAYAPDEVCCLNAFFSFGLSIANLFLPLMCGIPLVIVPGDDLKDINGLVDLIERERITRIVLVPPVFKQILDLGPKTVSKLRSIREVGLAGAVLTPDIIRRFTEAMPLAKLHNCYSSSEIGTLATVWNVTPESVVNRETLIGRPVANTCIYVLDHAMNPVPVGVAGEIYVSAPHLARGYLNRPDLTAERFSNDPFCAVPGARLYRTGDLARYLPGGDLEYLGRTDNQVKIRGFRVELAEIEAGLCSHPGVAQAVVTPRDSRNTSLAAFLVWKSETPVAVVELRRFLAERLPDFMIPAIFTPIDRVPLLASGKVDRNALPAPSGPDLGKVQAVPPANAEEAWLWEIWVSVLGISNIGVCDSFFDLGGNSLQAAALMSRIGERLNRRVPATVLLRESTIRQLAAYLGREESYPPGIVPLQIGCEPPLYVINPPGSMRYVAERLGSDRTVISVEIPETEALGLRAMASEIARRIREYQPGPPYFLAGWCASGNLAFEVAQQIHAAGTRVELVVLFESFNFAQMRTFRHWYRRAAWHFSNFRTQPVSEIPGYVRGRLRQGLLHVMRLGSLAGYRWAHRFGPQNGLLQQPLPPAEALNRAAYDYVPSDYTGEVVLFRPENQPDNFRHDPTLGWRSIAPRLRIIYVPGGHTTMFFPPHVDRLALQLAALLAGGSGKERR